MSSKLDCLSSNKCFTGVLRKYRFNSEALGGLDTNFNLFLPSIAREENKVPILFYLAGLTCTEDTGAQKAGFFRDASKHNIALLFPDTSPRGANIEGEEDSWDFGTGAGFYLDATSPKYSKHYNMYTHITQEIPDILRSSGLPIDLERKSIFGHSMGGHGSLTIYLRSLKSNTPFKSASAFAPVANPIDAPWGKKAFEGYLKGGVEEAKDRYDATILIAKAEAPVKILIHTGILDQFYDQKQLLPENFEKASAARNHPDDFVSVNFEDGYDHSYYFISTFGPEHIEFHAKFLKE